MVQPNRKRGGQPGNRNSLKHGYYSRIFTEKSDKKDFCSAGDIQGIDEEIALIRHVIKTVAQNKDKESLAILVRATNALNRLVRTRQKLSGRYDNMGEAIARVVEDFLKPMGVTIGPGLSWNFPPTKSITKNENEAELP